MEPVRAVTTMQGAVDKIKHLSSTSALQILQGFLPIHQKGLFINGKC